MANEREITIYDITRELKNSATAVSRGLQDHPTICKKTRKKLFDLAEKPGCCSNHFARSLRNQKNQHTGYYRPQIEQPFYIVSDR